VAPGCGPVARTATRWAGMSQAVAPLRVARRVRTPWVVRTSNSTVSRAGACAAGTPRHRLVHRAYQPLGLVITWKGSVAGAALTG